MKSLNASWKLDTKYLSWKSKVCLLDKESSYSEHHFPIPFLLYKKSKNPIANSLAPPLPSLPVVFPKEKEKALNSASGQLLWRWQKKALGAGKGVACWVLCLFIDSYFILMWAMWGGEERDPLPVTHSSFTRSILWPRRHQRVCGSHPAVTVVFLAEGRARCSHNGLGYPIGPTVSPAALRCVCALEDVVIK